ncbi:HvfC/BufC N-terminal domain-containing protein [Alteromonas sp. a30]|uniref:HvfC/BufC N-terminal domain-containing protein n=1 Tax=Alteromonas sp. a30 TaxID=2730917 RepID=UPI002280DBFF|nr:DNA-binding domain-containing protein [Alteromonas sp. a30]MCY7296896.1 DUF2063 domain-containing protein [Alteromonas sp. a30]
MEPKLSQTQQDFMQALLNSRPDNAFLSQIAESQKLSAQAHLAIYQRSYIARLQQCMAAQFSALKSALGDSLFFMFTADYLSRYPSQSYTLNNLGERFADYLQETRPALDDSSQEDWPAFIIELARFEYTLNIIFDQPQPDWVKNADLTTQDENLLLNPVSRICSHVYPVCDYFRALKRDESVEIPLPKPEKCMVIRQNFRLGMVQLDSEEALLAAQHLNDGGSWSSLLSCCSPHHLPALLTLKKRWLKTGVLISTND